MREATNSPAVLKPFQLRGSPGEAPDYHFPKKIEGLGTMPARILFFVSDRRATGIRLSPRHRHARLRVGNLGVRAGIKLVYGRGGPVWSR